MEHSHQEPAPGPVAPPESRLIWASLAYACVPLALVLWHGGPGVDWAWDLAMATGVTAGALLALLPVLSARWWTGPRGGATRLRAIQRLHRDLAWLCVAFVLVHVVALLLLEPRTVDYLLLPAPGYMLAGLGALLLMLALNLSSLARWKRRWPHGVWRRWHAAMSLVTVALALWHLLGAGFYFSDAGAQVALLCLLGIPALLALWWHCQPPVVSGRAPRETGRGPRRTGRLATLALILAVLAACVWWARALSVAPPAVTPYPCPAGRCL